MNFKVGDLVKIKNNDVTKLLKAHDLMLAPIGEPVVIEYFPSGEFSDFVVVNYGKNKTELVAKSWIEKVEEDEIEVPKNNGPVLTIQFDGENIDIDCDTAMADLSDKEVSTLYSLVEALYDLLEV